MAVLFFSHRSSSLDAYNLIKESPFSTDTLIEIDPLHVCGNAANLEDKTRFFYRSENFFCFVLQIGCIPTDVQGVYFASSWCMQSMNSSIDPNRNQSMAINGLILEINEQLMRQRIV